nr:hypothetical protein [Tanacetum cinerariifolium]
MDYGACKKLVGKGDESLRCLDSLLLKENLIPRFSWMIECKSSEIYPYEGITSYGYCLWIVSSGWSSVFTVLGQMTYPITSLTLDSARSYVMQGAYFTHGIVSSIPIGGKICSKGFLLPILLLVVIIVTVVIIAVILIVIVVVTVILVVIVVVKVFIAIIGVVVVIGDVSSILKLSFMIIGFLCRIVELCFITCSINLWVMVIASSKSSGNAISNQSLDGSQSYGRVDLIRDEDPTYEDGDTGMDDSTGVSTSLDGEISSGEKKS